MGRILNGDLAKTLQPEALLSGEIGLLAALIAVGCDVGVGVIAARRPDSLLDRGLVCAALVIYSMPNFGWAFLLILIGTTFLFNLTGGLIFYDPSPCCHGPQILLPAFALGLPFVGYIARQTRVSLREVLGLDHVTTARAKGLTENRVLRVHALRNAVIVVYRFLDQS